MTNLLNAALDAHANGLCPIPAATTGTKQPWPDGPSWKRYQTERPTPDQLDAWFAGGQYDGLGIVCGDVSGNLELIEFEGRAVKEGVAREFAEIAEASGRGDLWRRVVAGYSDQTPSGGIHVLIRVDGTVAGNTKLASRPSTPEELAAWKAEQQTSVDAEQDDARRVKRQESLDRIVRGEQVPQVLIETRGERGFVVSAPSGGRTHPSGGSWTMVMGGFSTIATITPEERDFLHHLAGALDQMPAGQAAAPTTPPARALFTQPTPVHNDEDGISPGDDYTARTTWEEILISRLNWTKVYTSGGVTYWRRSGKNIGISATTGRNDADNLYVFSSSTEFETERPYDRFGAIVRLDYGGNFSAAAKALRAQGYGSERQQRSRDETAELYALAGTAPTVHGNLAVVHQLHPAAETAEEGPEDVSDSFLAAQVAADLLLNRFRWCAGLGWLQWDGKRWVIADDTVAIEEIRLYLTAQFEEKTTQAGAKLNQGRLKELLTMLSATKVRNVTALSHGIEGVRTDAAELDADPDLLNTPSGVVDLKTGQLRAHDPALLMTKITSGSYRPGYTNTDWDKALEALPKAEQDWYQVRAGQAITGHPNPDGILVLLQGGGENGKSLLTTDGVVLALGDYADVASHKLLSPGNEHSEEMASLRGQRFLVSEEMTEGRALNVTAVKRIQDVGTIKARHVYGRNMTFSATHSLFATTNYLPVVNETDTGTWRRLALLVFPYTFKKPGQECRRPEERPGDPRLKSRIRANRNGQHDAIVTWVVEGARRWYATPDTAMAVTETVEADTRMWRADADRVLGFWDARLIGDPATCVLTTDMLEAFNEWLVGNGHKAWPKELFGPRFKGHSETTGHGVEERRTTKLAGLVRHRLESQFSPALSPVPKQPTVYIGVRFRTDDDPPAEGRGNSPDQQEASPLQTCQTSSELSQIHIETQEVSKGSDRSASDLGSKINGFSQPSHPVGTCQACGQLMTMLTADQTLHPGCG